MTGSIPARAGEPSAPTCGRSPWKVYPRACGGTSLQNLLGAIPLWSIPARAGEPARSAAQRLPSRVYPRACGGTAVVIGYREAGKGLSPRVRGNRRGRYGIAPCCGSIPARAGEPGPTHKQIVNSMVYPRACGGTALRAATATHSSGLSPRVRGNPRCRRTRDTTYRSIPARAGEPSSGKTRPIATRVYPRACGGTPNRGVRYPVRGGLSPRVRGNLALAPAHRRCRGSIPARAGEPRGRGRGQSQCGVYPRACGGTSTSGWIPIACGGLSPRVRGNRLHEMSDVQGLRSIPARAGEPKEWAKNRILSAVYPRACGGTRRATRIPSSRGGLSPRVRGNHDDPRVGQRHRGSIPARAGEPGTTARTSENTGVYPRACGGTHRARRRLAVARGLSPRVRGNQGNEELLLGALGSIPARAGEPPRCGSWRW